jgi:hypothetical protein
MRSMIVAMAAHHAPLSAEGKQAMLVAWTCQFLFAQSEAAWRQSPTALLVLGQRRSVEKTMLDWRFPS